MAPQKTSSYLKYLPAIFTDADGSSAEAFAGRFLLAFEQVLSGLDGEQTDGAKTDASRIGLEQTLDRIHTYFEPGPDSSSDERTPTEFLDWLAGWVALSVRDDWNEDEKRSFISRMARLYRIRGTKASLVELLRINTGVVDVTITEDPQKAHFFAVTLHMAKEATSASSTRMIRLAEAIINLEKPAHTYFYLEATKRPKKDD